MRRSSRLARRQQKDAARPEPQESSEADEDSSTAQEQSPARANAPRTTRRPSKRAVATTARKRTAKAGGTQRRRQPVKAGKRTASRKGAGSGSDDRRDEKGHEESPSSAATNDDGDGEVPASPEPAPRRFSLLSEAELRQEAAQDRQLEQADPFMVPPTPPETPRGAAAAPSTEEGEEGNEGKGEGEEAAPAVAAAAASPTAPAAPNPDEPQTPQTLEQRPIAAVPSSALPGAFRTLNLLIRGRRERIDFDPNSPTAQNDVALAIRSLLGVPLDARRRRAVFYLQDSAGQVHVLSKWLLAQGTGTTYTVRQEPVAGVPKVGLRAQIYAGAAIAVTVLVEAFLGNPFPARVPRVNYAGIYAVFDASPTVGVVVNFLFLASWVVASALLSRIPMLVYAAKTYYPRLQGLQADWTHDAEQVVDRRLAFASRAWTSTAWDRFPLPVRQGFVRGRAALAALRVCVQHAAAPLAVATLVAAERPTLIGPHQVWWAYVAILAASAMLVVRRTYDEELGTQQAGIAPAPLQVGLQPVRCFPERVELRWRVVHATGDDATASETAGFNFRVECRQQGRPETAAAAWSPARVVRVKERVPGGARRTPWLTAAAVFALLAVAARYPTVRRSATKLALTVLAVVWGLPQRRHGVAGGTFSAAVLDLPCDTAFEWRVVPSDLRGKDLAPSEVRAGATFSRQRPNRMYYVYEDALVYRSTPLCWGALAQDKPPLRNERPEVDAFMDTVRSALLPADQAPASEDDPDVVTSYPQEASRHVSVSRHYLQQLHSGGSEQTLRVHAPGSRVGSYALESEVWNQLDWGKRRWVAQAAVRFFIVANVAFAMVSGGDARLLRYVLDLGLAANFSWLALKGAQLLLQSVGTTYAAVGAGAVLVAITADLLSRP